MSEGKPEVCRRLGIKSLRYLRKWQSQEPQPLSPGFSSHVLQFTCCLLPGRCLHCLASEKAPSDKKVITKIIPQKYFSEVLREFAPSNLWERKTSSRNYMWIKSVQTRCIAKARLREKSTFLAIFWGFLIFSGSPVL